MNGNITIELGSPAFELTPEKPKRFLEKALKRGLTVRFHGSTAATRSLGWTIESPDNPIDDWQLWLYFQPGARGGSLTITRYAPRSGRKANATKLNRMQAGIAIDDMGDMLDRHKARVAQAEAAMRQVGQELDGATIPAVPVVEPTIARALTAAAPAADPNPAQVALGALRPNGRFAVRAAHNGAIPRNTPAKVRMALVRRGLVHAAGGVLTELGRTVRTLIIT